MATSSNNKVSLCSKTCIDSYNKLKTLYDEQTNQLSKQEAKILAYTLAVKKLEAQVVSFQKQQLSLNEQLTFQANEIYAKDEKLKKYRRIGMKAIKEKEQLQKTVDSWKNSSKTLWKLVDSGMTSNSKVGLGYEIQSNNEVLSYEEEMNHTDSTSNTKDYTPKPQEEIDDSLYVYGKKGPQKPETSVSDDKFSENSVTSSEEVVSEPKPKEVEPSCVTHVKTPRQPMKNQGTPKVNGKNWNEMMERELGEGYSFIKKKCFVCGSLSHLIKDCDFYEKKMAREAELKKQRVFNTGNGVAKPVWNNANRVNHANHFVPRPVQLIAVRQNVNSVRPNVNTGRANVNSVRQNVNSVRSNVNTGSFNINTVKAKQPINTSNSNSFSPVRPQVNKFNQRSNFSKSHSPVRRPIVRNTARMTYSHAVKGNWGTAVKTSAGYNWRKTRPNSNCNSGSNFIRTDHPLKNMEDRGIFDSGCSGHMTGNKDHLDDFEECKGGSVTFGGSKGYITGKGRIRVGNLDFDSVSFVKELGHFNLFSISQICDKQHKVLFTETECLVVSPDFKMPDENQILLKVPRQHNMYDFNIKTPALTKDYACLIAKVTSDESKLWHRRFSWVFFLATKDETSGILQNFFRQIENQLNHRNQTNPHAGTSEVTNSAGTLQTPNANASEEEDEAEELIIVPTTVRQVGPRKSSTNSKAEEFFTELQNLKTQEKEAYSTGISEDTPEILAFRRELDELAPKHLSEVPKNKATSTTSVNSGSGPVNTQHADQDDSDMPELTIFNKPQKGIFDEASYDDEGMVHDFNNLPTEVAVSPIPTLRIHNIHPQSQILGDPKSSVQTRSRVQQHSRSNALDMLNKVTYKCVTAITLMETKDGLDKRWGRYSKYFTLNGVKKEHTIVATSTTEAEYVAAASCCGQCDDSGCFSNCFCSEDKQIKQGIQPLPYCNLLPFFISPPVILKPWSEPTPVAEPTPHPKSPSPEPNSEPIEHTFEQPSPEHQPLSPRQVIRVPQSQDPTHPHVAEERTMSVDDLLQLVPKLLTKVDGLETELKQTKLTMGKVLVKLVKKVKKMEDVLKRRHVVLPDSEDEDFKGKDFEDISTGFEDISIGFEEVNTGGLGVSTGSGPVSSARGQREGKAPMIVEETQAPKRTKEQIQQEEASLAEAIRLQTLEEEETAKQVHLDALLAKRMEEEELTEQQKQRKAQVQFEAQHYTEEDWDAIRAKLEANAELTKNVLGKELPEEDFAKKMVELVNQRKKFFAEERAKARRSKPMTQSLLRNYMMNYLKNQGTWKLTQLKKLSFEEVKEEFDKLVKQVESFVPINIEATKAQLKRYGEELQTEISKKQRIDDKDVSDTEEKVGKVKEEEPVKRVGKRKKQKARKGISIDKSPQGDSETDKEESVEAMNPTPLDTKSNIVANWKIFQQGERSIYQIIRANGADTVYMSFGAMLKDFTREDLIELYRLVMQKYGTNRPEDAYDRVLWSDLRTMFDPPLNEDAIWSLPLQQKMISWRYYDKCAVHCLTLEACNIYMLADRKYPLSKDACQVMLKMKLLDGKMNEVCYKLLKMIEKQAGVKK
ncbi:hypothetical protein Tco_1317764 [Tanacetum coccineum]